MPITVPPSPRDSLADARLYLCTDACGFGRRHDDLEPLRTLVRAAYAGGVDVVQLRDKGLEARFELAALEVLAEEAMRAGRLWAVNDRADIAALTRAPVLHVGQDDLTAAHVEMLAPSAAVGLSTHDGDQLAAALADPRLAYFCVGPVWATPTKPGRPAAGLDLVRAAAESATATPWFAIGGIDLSNIDDVVAAGATRVVVVRAITDAADPEAAARALRARLPSPTR